MSEVKNPFLALMEQQITAVNSGMQTIIKANMQIFEGYQQQLTKMIATQADFLGTNGPGLAEVLKEQTDGIMAEIKKNADLMRPK